ncbi:diguanylate cyclase/phosphodiesterase (GGDEF & EAL domains) with PAS/PAC sensor(s) [hydrothermal vent metagenome]|uniref:histidine kinase n=1 Tax=hydrothermal vent metagenome TaxID=652676 RepID=A0A3B1CKJ8_9ZZZZ
MSFRSINARLSVLMAAIAVVSFATLGYFSLTFAKSVIRRDLENSIVSALNLHKSGVENYFERIESKIFSLASGFALVQAMAEFEEAVYLVDPEIKTALLKLGGARASPPASDQEPEYALYEQIKSKYDPFFRDIAAELGVYDLMLIEPERGYIIYSASKGADFGASALDAERKKTWLGRAVGYALVNFKESSSFSPFEPYPGPDSPLSAFMARPILDAGQLEGVVVMRVQAKRLKTMLAPRPDARLHLFVYILDPEKRVIAVSGGGQRQWSGAVEPSGRFSLRPGPDGESFLSLSAPLEIGGSDYSLVVEADVNEAFSQMGELKLVLLLSLFPVGLAVLISLFVINRSVTRPIAALGEAMKSVASTGSTAGLRLAEKSDDEIGVLSHLFNAMSQRLETLGARSQSRTRSFDKYAESLESKTGKMTAEAKKRDEALERSGERIEEALEIIERQRIELTAQERRLDIDRTYLKKIDEANERFLMVVESELKGRLNLLLNRAGAASTNFANREAVDLLDEIRVIDELVDKAVAGFEFGSGHDPVKLKPVNLAKLAKQAVDKAAELADKRKLKLVFTKEAISPMILADQNQIRVAMNCLIENGLKYTPAKGSVHVTVKDIGSAIRFEVKDTGEGVEKENIQKIFQKFYRVESDSGEPVNGMGMGLYICRMIIRRHDGRIGAESEPGKGSVFFFELNKKSAPEQDVIPGLG